jgi:hypothetical protein
VGRNYTWASKAPPVSQKVIHKKYLHGPFNREESAQDCTSKKLFELVRSVFVGHLSNLSRKWCLLVRLGEMLQAL